MESNTFVDYLRKNLEFTKPACDEIAEILFRSKCA